MNSYPVELTHHVYASMLVAGLTRPSTRAPSLTRSESSSSRTTRTETARVHGQAAPDKTSSQPQDAAVVVPGPSAPSLLLSPEEVFPDLCKQLADIFSSRGRNVVWDPARGRSAVFHTVLVDHTVRLPPRKTRPSPRSIAAPDSALSSATLLAALPPRSPLSPLHPGSPLFPDGLIAPIWARKHREIVPSIFVAFHCLVEPYIDEEATDAAPIPSVEGDSSSESQQSKRKGLTGQELKARDEELIKLISDRKRGLMERGIKLTVVLLTSRAMLENPQLEARLSYIRRSSGLDSKASLFVLTPVPRDELGAFVTSLQDTLYEHSMDYYREHARRIRRKRARYPPGPAVVQPILQSVAASRVGGKAQELSPLSREGWHARAEYKLAMFSELHGDYESALSHYQEAYDLLAGLRGMLGSTVLLPPRTKRWAEAKVLCDTISLRICRLYLYGENGEAALVQFRRHIARFVELSSGWGIGDATFEFWSWLSKQYRLMGDILDQAMRLIPASPLPPFQIPLHAPPLPPYLLHPNIADHAQDYSSLRSAPGALLSPNQAALALGVAPSSMLQGPGAFYFLAAVCAEQRKKRFERMRELEKKGEVSESGAAALIHEKTVDHAAQIIEVYGRARDVFRAANLQRHSLSVAAYIATIYADGGQWKMALRFLERVIPPFKGDDWPAPLVHLLMLAIACAERSGDPRTELHFLLEALAAFHKLRPEDRQKVYRRWIELADAVHEPNSSGSEDQQVSPPQNSFEACQGPLIAKSVFKEQTVAVGLPADFQVTIENPHSPDGPTLAFDEIVFRDQQGAIILKGVHVHAEDTAVAENVRIFAVGLLEEESIRSQSLDLMWPPGTTKVFSGMISSKGRNTVRISSIELKASSPLPYEVLLTIPLGEPLQSPEAPRWLTAGPRGRRNQWVDLEYRSDPSSCFSKPPSHNLSVEFNHHKIGYLDEAVTIDILVRNLDRETLVCSADVMLQPAYQGSQDELGHSVVGQPTLTGSLKGLEFGRIAPGASARSSFFLRGRHRSAVRSMSIFLQSRPETSSSANDDVAGPSAGPTIESTDCLSETVHELAFPIQRVFRAEYSAEWRKGSNGEEDKVDEDMARVNSQLGNGNGKTNELLSETTFDDMPRSPLGKSTGDTAVAYLHAAFGVLSADEIMIQDVSVTLDEDYSSTARLLPSSADEEGAIRRGDDACKETLEGRWREGDRWGYSWQVEVDLNGLSDSSRSPTGHLVLHWSRAQSSDEDESAKVDSRCSQNVTRLPLPILAPPHLNARVLVASPPVTHVLQAFTLVFVVVNPSSSQMDVNVFIDDSPAWIVGNRTLSIPGIPARGSRSVPTRLVPRTEGMWLLPRVRAFQQRTKEEMGTGLILNETQYGIPLHVRFRASAGATLGAAAMRAIASGRIRAEQEGPTLSVLVLPQDTST